MNQRKAPLPLTLPNDLIVEILLRLPVRSLLRFKCVCKSWLSLVSDPEFARSHFDIATTPTQRFLLKSANDSEVNFVDIEAPLHDDSAKVVFNVPHPSLAPKLGRSVDIVGSCRGFILLTVKYFVKINYVFEFVIWNPSTGLQKRIDYVSMHTHLCGFGYDSSTDDYMIVNIKDIMLSGPTEVQCFSLRTNSWSRIVCTVSYYPRARRMSPSMAAISSRLFGSDDYGPEIIGLGHRRHGLLLNEALHWLVRSCDHLPFIIAFDVRERRLSEIPLPHDLAIQLKSKICYLRVMGGCLCLCGVEKGGLGIAIWTMKEYKVQSSWIKSFVLSTNYVPMCFTKNGEILGWNDEALARLNDKGELLEHRAYGMEIRCGAYRESLLSLPG